MKYDVILADPPWFYNRRNPANKTRFGAGAGGKYPLMPTKEIAALPIADIANDRSILFLWATFPKIGEAFKVIDAWGFTYCTIGFLWVKLNSGRVLLPSRKMAQEIYAKGAYGFLSWLRCFGPGYYTASNTEPCLIARKGKAMLPTKRLSSVVFARRGKHSAKPREVHRRIEQMYPLDEYAHIELFARENRSGWVTMGDEVDGLKMIHAIQILGSA